MRYMLLIYADPAQHDTPELIERYRAFTKEVSDCGALSSSDALQRSYAATTVRVRNGKVVTSDGPYAETKEQIGGYYVLECADLDQAIAFAAKIPNAEDGAIEVRPVREIVG